VFLQRTIYRCLSQRQDDRAVRQRLKELAETRVRHGFPHLQVLVRREGWRDNHKRTSLRSKEHSNFRH
jgi:putative transposase